MRPVFLVLAFLQAVGWGALLASLLTGCALIVPDLPDDAAALWEQRAAARTGWPWDAPLPRGME